MNAKEWNEGLNYLDPALLEDFMQQKERLDQQIKRKNIWLRLGAAAACVCLLLLGAYVAHRVNNATQNPTDPSRGPVSPGYPLRLEMGMYLDNVLYLRDNALSFTATEENIGVSLGYASLDNKTATDVGVHRYISADSNGNRVIIPYGGNYYVYAFYAYMVPTAWTPGKTVWNGVTVEYHWTVSNGELYLLYDSADYHLERVVGSDRYMYLTIHGAYSYLLDAQTGEVLDPLAGLDREVLDYLTEVKFSPDGCLALISYRHGAALMLLDCKTGSKVDLPSEDIYSVSGEFLDNNTVLLVSACWGLDGEISYRLSRYDTSSGAYTQIPGSFVSKDPHADNFLAFAGGPFAYTYTDWKLTIVDLKTFQQVICPLELEEVIWVSYHSVDSIHVLAGQRQYLVKTDGSMRQVSE